MASDWPRTFLQPGCFCLAYVVTTKIFEKKLNVAVFQCGFYSYSENNSSKKLVYYISLLI